MGEVIYLDPANEVRQDMLNFLADLAARIENDEIMLLMTIHLTKEGNVGYYTRGTFDTPLDCIKISGILDWQKKSAIDAMEEMLRESDNGENYTEKKSEDQDEIPAIGRSKKTPEEETPDPKHTGPK